MDGVGGIGRQYFHVMITQPLQKTWQWQEGRRTHDNEARNGPRCKLQSLGIKTAFEVASPKHVVWCILVCLPHLTIIISHTAVWAQACGSERTTSKVTIFGSCGVLGCVLIPVGVFVGAVSRYCHFWYRLFGPQQP